MFFNEASTINTLRTNLVKTVKLDDTQAGQRYIMQDVGTKNNETTIRQLDLIEATLESMAQSRQYYVISRVQAWVSFFLSILFCLSGLVLLIFLGIKGFNNDSTTIIGLIVSGVSELFAATAMWVHKNSLKEFNHFYDELHENELILLAANLADRLPPEKKEDELRKIIDRALNDKPTSVELLAVK